MLPISPPRCLMGGVDKISLSTCRSNKLREVFMANSNASILSVTVSVSGGNLTRKHVLNVTMDFSNVDQTAVLQWATDNRVIALQRVLRATDDTYLDSLNGKLTVNASECGGKILTPTERIAKLVVAGMPPALASLAVNDPTKFNELMGSLNE